MCRFNLPFQAHAGGTPTSTFDVPVCVQAQPATGSVVSPRADSVAEDGALLAGSTGALDTLDTALAGSLDGVETGSLEGVLLGILLTGALLGTLLDEGVSLEDGALLVFSEEVSEETVELLSGVLLVGVLLVGSEPLVGTVVPGPYW